MDFEANSKVRILGNLITLVQGLHYKKNQRETENINDCNELFAQAQALEIDNIEKVNADNFYKIKGKILQKLMEKIDDAE